MKTEKICLNISSYTVLRNEFIENCEIKGEIIAGALMTDTTCKNVIFRNCVFYSSQFNKINFIGCRFENCEFIFCKFEHCEFTASLMNCCKWEFTRLQDTSWWHCELDRHTLRAASEMDAPVVKCFVAEQSLFKLVA